MTYRVFPQNVWLHLGKLLDNVRFSDELIWERLQSYTQYRNNSKDIKDLKINYLIKGLPPFPSLYMLSPLFPSHSVSFLPFSLFPSFLKLVFKIYVFWFYIYECLTACRYMHHMCAWCLWKSEVDISYSGTGVTSHHVGSGN